MLAQNQKITEPLAGDFLINDKFTIEVGGKGKLAFLLQFLRKLHE